MSAIIVILAWVGAVLWPTALLIALALGLKNGRGPGWAGWTAIVAVTALWGLGVRAALWEPETLVVRRVEVVSAMWKGGPLRVGVISDIHTAGPHMSPERLAGIVAQMNAEQPDIVLLLGDYVSGSKAGVERGPAQRSEVIEGLKPLAKLSAPFGVWSVLGNHDWWYDGPAIEQVLQAAGVKVLENARVRIDRPSGAFWLGGLADYESTRAQPSYGDTLKDLPEGDPVLVMSHLPDAFALAPERVFLTFAGHTHCGQVNLPVFGRMMHASPGSEKWPCGLYHAFGRKLYVTGGVGVSIFPVRFNQPPEIAVVTLRTD
jgi:predicted MPP superfamily phosphohydrolase